MYLQWNCVLAIKYTVFLWHDFSRYAEEFKILSEGIQMWSVKMTGEVKKWPVKRHFWPVIVWWPAVILSPAHFWPQKNRKNFSFLKPFIPTVSTNDFLFFDLSVVSVFVKHARIKTVASHSFPLFFPVNPPPTQLLHTSASFADRL